MPGLSRNQEMMKRAIQHVRAVEEEHENVRNTYGGLCHKFPILVRSCGLCQAAAFVESKVGSTEAHRKKAHELLKDHIGQVLAAHGFHGNADPSEIIADMDMRDYARATRIILNSWVYYKRFAESILKVEAGPQGDRP